MKRFIKENPTLVIGITLPILLVIIFYLAAVLPKMLVKRPQTDLLYLTTTYPHDGITTEIKEGTLRIWINPQVRKGSLPMPRLFRFHAKTLTSTEIPISLATEPGIVIASKQEELRIPELKDIKLNTEAVSKDGYKAEISSPNVGGVINLMLLNTKRTLIISKRGNIINISEDNKNLEGQKSIKFLGWIESK